MATLSTTTLGAAVTVEAVAWRLASVSGVTPGSILFADGEAVTVIGPASGLSVPVQRGALGSRVGPHGSGLTVYLGSSSQFYAQDPTGTPPSTLATDPWINTLNGSVWTSSGGVWVQVSGSALVNPAISGTVSGAATYVAPVLSDPAATSTGVMITKSGVLTELTGSATYTVTIAVPAGAFLHNILVSAQALWTAGTSAVLDVGDTADPDGYFAAVNVKATDLLVGEVLSTLDGDLWGGKNGAYLVSATGQRGPVTDNFGNYYAAGSNITFAVTKVGTGTAGRTAVSVTYSLGTVTAQT